jgi:hypothetical protein
MPFGAEGCHRARVEAGPTIKRMGTDRLRLQAISAQIEGLKAAGVADRSGSIV